MDIFRKNVMWPLDKLAGWIVSDTDWLWEKILQFFALFKVVEFEKNPPPDQILNRSLIIFREAKARGIEIEAIKIAGSYKNEYRFRMPRGENKWRYFEGNPLVPGTRQETTDHKLYFKKLMREHEIPVPQGEMFTDMAEALNYASRLGYPVVVKPATGSLGYHSTYFIKSEDKLTKAIAIAQIFRPDFLVEKHIFGTNYRATVLGKQHIFVCRKELPNIVGDGVSTVEQLIDCKNADPNRGIYGQKNTTLHQIPKRDPELSANLNRQGMHLASVPKRREKIFFYSDFLAGTGIDFINESRHTHPDNRELFIRASQALDTDLVGFDLICEDIRQPYRGQTFGILEANSLPYLDMHQFPSSGRPDPVAKIVWDLVLQK